MKRLIISSLSMLLLCCFSINSHAGLTINDADTLYYFAQQCSKKGKTAYMNTQRGWVAYSAQDIAHQYQWMIDSSLIGTGINKKEFLESLKLTRAQRLASAKSYLVCQ